MDRPSVSLLLLLIVSACSCDTGPSVPCGQTGQSEACGQICAEARPCPEGLFCNDEAQCDARCADGEGCGRGLSCTSDGQCVQETADAARPDAAVDGRSDGSDVCADIELRTRRTTPNVTVIVDQSGSMDEEFGSSDRWNVLRDSLLAEPEGLIFSLQSQVRFGLALFSGTEDVCPALTTVPFAIDNHGAIAAIYRDAELLDDTPTGDSMDALIDELEAAPDRTDDPTLFILATDGEPDTCEVPNPQEGQGEAIAAVERAFGASIRTYIISVGSDISEEHLQKMSNAGLGRVDGDPDAPFWVAGDDDGLRAALQEIISGALDCRVELNGRIDPATACSGNVELNGTPLECDGPNGWHVVDETHIELSGDACELFLDNATSVLRASFPCSVVLI